MNKESLLQIRAEANAMKDCFTRYSFQTISISVIGLGIILRLIPEIPIIGLAGVGVAILNLTVARIGIYKFGGAHRNVGFELFVGRMKNLTRKSRSIASETLLEVTWEEAMKAWRIVQPSIFSTIHIKKKRTIFTFFFAQPDRLRDDYKKPKRKWWEQGSQLECKTEYYAGSYLKMMLAILAILSAGALIAVASVSIQYYAMCYPENEYVKQFFAFDPKDLPSCRIGLARLTAFVAVVASVMVVTRFYQLWARLTSLESGFLSIHANCIVWHLTVTAHCAALRAMSVDGFPGIPSYRKYTNHLSKQTKEIVESLGPNKSIYDWLENK